MRCCPLCGSLRVRSLEKQTGRPYITPSTYMPLTRCEGPDRIKPIITDDIHSDPEEEDDSFYISLESDSVWSSSSLTDYNNISSSLNSSDSALSVTSRLPSSESVNGSHEESRLPTQEPIVKSDSFSSTLHWDSETHTPLVKSPIYTWSTPIGI